MPDVPPAEHGFGLFGPDFGVPLGGFCLSTFLVVERDGQLLTGQMDPTHDDTWIDSWAPNIAFYDGARRDGLFDGYRFPATYIQEGEHPREAATRVWRDQLGFGKPPALEEPTIVSATGASRRAPDARHWDLLFIYEADGPELPAEAPEHWGELAYQAPEQLLAEDLVMLHGELLEML